MAKLKKERMFTTSIQLSSKQLLILDEIVTAKNNRSSNAQILREAFDFYVKQKYPQFKKQTVE